MTLSFQNYIKFIKLLYCLDIYIQYACSPLYHVCKNEYDWINKSQGSGHLNI